MFNFFRTTFRSTPISKPHNIRSTNRTFQKKPPSSTNLKIPQIATCIVIGSTAMLTLCVTAHASMSTLVTAPKSNPQTTLVTLKPPETTTIPRNKLQKPKDPKKQPIILIACGSFSPITIMHLRILEMAKDYYNERGFEVLGGYFSPVADSYAKKGLVPAEHRRKMIEIAIDDSDWLMVDAWESLKPHWTETVKVLDHFHKEINSHLPEGSKSIKVHLICGSDLLDSFNKPGVWAEKDTLTICQYGIGVVAREGADPERVIWTNDLLYSQRENIHIIHQWIPNDISSTRVRMALSRNLSVKYLIPDGVLEYIRENGLYKHETTSEKIIK